MSYKVMNIILLGWLCSHSLGETAFEFNGYFFHGAIKCYQENVSNTLAGPFFGFHISVKGEPPQRCAFQLQNKCHCSNCRDPVLYKY